MAINHAVEPADIQGRLRASDFIAIKSALDTALKKRTTTTPVNLPALVTSPIYGTFKEGSSTTATTISPKETYVSVGNTRYETYSNLNNVLLAVEGQKVIDILLKIKEYPALYKAVDGQPVPAAMNSLLSYVNVFAAYTDKPGNTTDTGGCQSACVGFCQKSCSTTCTGGCQTANTGDPGTGCSKICTGGCTGGCGGGCDSGCSGCSGRCSGCDGGCNASSYEWQPNCGGSCSQDCGTCGSSCGGDCDGRCSGDCDGDCSGDCGGTCEGSCDGSCGTGCWGTCKGGCNGCSSGCQGTCNKGCQTNCTGGCATTCSGTNRGTITWA